MKQCLAWMAVCLLASACDHGAATSANPRSNSEKAPTEQAKSNGLELDGLKSQVPADWVAEKPSSNMRMAQFKVPRVAGDSDDAILVVSFFGKGSGGSFEDNLERWRAEFTANEKEPKDPGKIESFKVGAVNVQEFDISGTHLTKIPPFAPNPKIERRPNYRMFAVSFESPNGPYFIKLTGPAKTMEHHKKAFDEWLKNFK
jgi:hypothetical protein